MGFFDRLGDIVDRWRDVRSGIAFEVAKVVTDDEDARKVARWFGNQTGTGERFGDVLGALDVPVSYGVKRPLATLRDVTGDEDPGLIPDFFLPNRWREAWNDSATTSIGQQFAGSFGLGTGGRPVDADELTPEERHRYFTQSTTGRVFSGAVDALLYIPDPLVTAGRIPGAIKAGRETVRADDVARVFAAGEDVASGAVSLTRRQDRQRRLVEGFIRATEGRTVSELAETAMFRQSADGGTLAYWFGKANEITDEATRFETKREILAAAFGDRSAVERIRRYSDGLADDVAYMTSQIDELEMAKTFSTPDGFDFTAALGVRNDPARLRFLTNQRDKIDEQIIQARRLAGQRGLDAGIAGDLTRIRTDLGYGRVSAVIDDGHVSRSKIHVITGKRIPGTFRASDPRAPEVFRDVLARSRDVLPVERRRELLDRFVVATPKERAMIAVQAENEIWAHLGKKYNLQKGQLESLLRTARGRRAAYLRQLKSRAYGSVDADSYVPLVDESGVVMAIDRQMVDEIGDVPMLSSQLTEQISMIDPREVDRLLKRYASSEAGLAGFFQQVTRGGARVWEPTEHALSVLNHLWKFSALFRIAYPLRVQVDTQLRLMAALRAQYLVFAARGSRNYVKSLRYMNNAERRALTQRIGMEADEVVGQLGRYDATVFRNREELTRVWGELSPEDSVLTLLTDAQAADLRRLRATGAWDRIAPDRPEWMQNYLRVVNKQFRNDPVAKRMLAGESDEAIARWLRTDPDGRQHWRLLRDGYGEPEVLLQRVRQNLDELLPADSALRNTATVRQLRPEDVDRFWRLPADRPAVRGEILTEKSPVKTVTDYLNDLAAKWYNEASTMPELAMGRHPLYVARFREYFKQRVLRHESIDGKLSLEQLEEIRLQASRLAQRDVSKVLFDLFRQGDLAHAMRFVSPFFAAWEDTMKKWGRLIGADPGLLPRGYQLWGAPNAAGLVVDENGNQIKKNGDVVDDQGRVIGHKNPLDPGQYVILNIGIGKAGIGSLRLSKTSFNIVFQGDPFWMPGPGPMAAIPVNTLLTGAFPEFMPGAEALKAWGPTQAESAWAKWFLPYGPEESAGAVARPAWVDRLWSLWQGNESIDYRKTYIQLNQELENQIRLGDLPPMNDREKSDYLNRQVRNWFIIRALTAQAAPISVMPQSPLQFYLEEYRRYSREFGVDAAERFRADYPEYYEMAIRLTKTNTGLNATVEAWEGVQEFRPMLARNPEYGWALAGAANVGGEFSQGVYSAQMVQAIGHGSTKPFRESLDPIELAKRNAAEEGWQEYRTAMTELRMALEERGLRSFDQADAADLNALRKQFVEELKQANPAWAEDYVSGGGNEVEKFLRWATGTAMRDPRLARRGDFRTLSEYVEGRAFIIEQLQAREYSSLNHPSNVDIKEAWDTFVADLIQSDLGFEQMYQRVLERDDLGSMRPIREQ